MLPNVVLFGPAAGTYEATGIDALDAGAPTLAITNASELPDSATQTLTGTIDAADAGLTISIDDDGAQVGTATANASGAWTATVTLSGDDPHTLTAQATDSAALTGVSNALYLAMAGGETITFADASGDAASLYGTANDWDFCQRFRRDGLSLQRAIHGRRRRRPH